MTDQTSRPLICSHRTLKPHVAVTSKDIGFHKVSLHQRNKGIMGKLFWTYIYCKCTNMIHTARIRIKLSSNPRLSCSPLCHPPYSEAFPTFIWSPFHVEEQLLWRSSASLSSSLSLWPLLPHFLSSLTLSQNQRESHCLNQMCHKLVRWCLFSAPPPHVTRFSERVCFNTVYIFDKVLWHSLHSHITRNAASSLK